MAKVSDYAIDNLIHLPLSVLANLEIETQEEEALIQAVVDRKRAAMPVQDVYRKDFINEWDDTPEKEAERQKIIDQRVAQKRGYSLQEEITEEVVPIEKTPTVEEAPKVVEPTVEEVAQVVKETAPKAKTRSKKK